MQRKNSRILLLAIVGMTISLSGCAMAPTAMIYKIEATRKKVQEEKEEKERLQKEAIAQEQREREYEENKAQLLEVFDQTRTNLEEGNLKKVSKELAGHVKDEEEVQTYYTTLFEHMEQDDPVIEGDTATTTFTARRIKNKEEVVNYLNSQSFQAYVEQERVSQNLWAEEDIENLRQNLIEAEIANSKFEEFSGTITYKRLNDKWTLESIADEEGAYLAPKEGELGLC